MILQNSVIRSETGNLKPENLGHYSLSSKYSDEFYFEKIIKASRPEISSFF